MSFFKNIKEVIDKISYDTCASNNEQVTLNKIEIEIKSINTEIDSAYTQIGRKVIDYIDKSGEPIPNLDINDILTMLSPKLARKEELEKQSLEIQKRLKDQEVLRAKNKLINEFELEKEKLDKALAMDIISQNEYNSKISKFRARIDYFEDIRKIEAQYDMGIITLDEKNNKISKLLDI